MKIPGEEAKRCFLSWKMSPQRILLEKARNRVDLKDRPIVDTDIQYQNIIDIYAVYSHLFISVNNLAVLSMSLFTFIYVYLCLIYDNL